MILTEKPWVHRMPDGRWLVWVWHDEGVHTEYWRTHTAAMNCALAIARTSTYEESPCPTR